MIEQRLCIGFTISDIQMRACHRLRTEANGFTATVAARRSAGSPCDAEQIQSGITLELEPRWDFEAKQTLWSHGNIVIKLLWHISPV